MYSTISAPELYYIKMTNSIDGSGSSKMTKVAMFLLAAYPILMYYAFFDTPFNYANLSAMILALFLMFKKGFSIFRELPVQYYIYWLYAAFQMIFIAGIMGWSDYFPGGVTLCLFSLAIASYAYLFDINCLYKYMRAIWLFATVLFLLQVFIYFATGSKISVFLPLSQNLTYGDFSYSEMLAHQKMHNSGMLERFSSIFCEPSYFGQYSVVFLALELFRKEAKDKLFTPLSVFIALIIILIQSGAGLLGLALIVLIKLLQVLVVSRNVKYYLMLLLLIPLIVFIASRYLGSDMGSYVVERSSELQMDEKSTQSGNMRIYYGWLQYGLLSPYEQALGTSRNFTSSFYDEGGFVSGACTLFINLGWIGAALLFLFYLRILKKDVLSIALFLIFILFMLVESIYLGGIMIICTSVLLAITNKHEEDLKASNP